MAYGLRRPVGILAFAAFILIIICLYVAKPLIANHMFSNTSASATTQKLDLASEQSISGADASGTTKVLAGILIGVTVALVVVACFTPLAPVAGVAALEALGGWGGATVYLTGDFGVACAAYGPCQP